MPRHPPQGVARRDTTLDQVLEGEVEAPSSLRLVANEALPLPEVHDDPHRLGDVGRLDHLVVSELAAAECVERGGEPCSSGLWGQTDQGPVVEVGRGQWIVQGQRRLRSALA